MFDARQGALEKEDPAMRDVIRRECCRQEEHIEPIASANHTLPRGIQ